MKKMKECVNGHMYDPEQNSTCPHCRSENHTVGVTEPGAITEPSGNSTMPLDDYGKPFNPTETMPGWEIFGEKQKVPFNPVVGWLVVVEGECRGRDFRLVSGVNSVGRGIKQAVSMETDQRMSREHCSLYYYHEINEFYIEDHSSHGTFLNKKPVIQRTQIQNGDRIKAGHTTFLLRTLCDDTFVWEVEE